MTYHEHPSALTPQPTLRIGDSLASEESYELDAFGHDDGTDRRPHATFRLMFQVGLGYEIYLYVVGLRCAGDPRGFHSFWLRNCAAYDVEVAEYGPQKRVTCKKVTLPPVFARVSVASGTQTASYTALRFTFESRPTDMTEPDFEACWHVRNASDEVAAITYASRDGWRFSDASGERTLASDASVTFADPIAPVRDWPTTPPAGITWLAATYPGDRHGGPCVSTVAALLDHATALASIRGHMVVMNDASVSFGPGARHVMTIRSETEEAHGPSGNDSYRRFVTV